MTPRRTHRLMAALLSFLALQGAAQANTVTFPITGNLGQPNGVPLIDILMKDKAGKAITLKGIVDSGNDDNFSVSKETADALGLTAGPEREVIAGAGKIKIPTVTIPAGNPGTIGQAVASAPKQFNLSVTGVGDTLPGIPKNHVLIGTQVLNPDPAKPGSTTINWATKKITVRDNDQAKTAALMPLRTDMALVDNGTLHVPGTGQSHAIVASVGFHGHLVQSSFLLSTGFDHSVISASLASALGVVPSSSLNAMTELETYTLPSATVNLQAFGSEGARPLEVGILPSSLYQGNLNVLGMDFLSRYDAIEMNGATLTFSATPVPEPQAMAFAGAGVLVLGWLGLLRRRQLD